VIILYILAIIIALVWVCGFIYTNDFSVTTSTKIRNANRVLIIFPHADDEVMTTGGLMTTLSRLGSKLTWIIVTSGEKGTPRGTVNTDLINIRRLEAEKVAKVFGVQTLIQLKYPDGNLENTISKLKAELDVLIREIKPNIVITYDLSGLYGHPDHITLSMVVTKIVKDNPEIKLLYASFPSRILNTISLPKHMAKNTDYAQSRAYPSIKTWIGLNGILCKIKASYSYISQGGGSSRNMPIKWIPMWFYISLTLYEYFHEVKLDK